ncbi:MAG: hypothetical protein WC759_02630 [Candidatus Micrarchaeia archaeon]
MEFLQVDVGDIGKLQALSLLNFIFSLVISWLALSLSLKMRGKTFSSTLMVLSIALLIFAVHQATFVLNPIPNVRWDVIRALTETLFALVIFYGLFKLGKSLDAYQHIIRQKK